MPILVKGDDVISGTKADSTGVNGLSFVFPLNRVSFNSGVILKINRVPILICFALKYGQSLRTFVAHTHLKITELLYPSPRSKASKSLMSDHSSKRFP